MKTDYKYWYVKRDDDGFITEAAIRFYEGEVFPIQSKMQYVRTKRLDAKDLAHCNGKFAKEKHCDVVIYNTSHFGKIKTDEQLNDYLDKQIKKDKKRIKA